MKAGTVRASAPMELMANLSSFFGRTDDVVELVRMLRGGRLLTLTGPAGVGKTRLALELVGRTQRARRCAVVIVELSSLPTGDLVPQQVTAAMGLEAPTTETLTAAFGDRNWLLVLDNCEHVLDGCGLLLSELLPRCPNVRVLATSLEALHLPGEMVHSVRGLSLPDGRTLTDYLRSDALRLFVDRAQALVPEFQLTKENAWLVADICGRLDGLPLAIEMAARLVRAFPLTEIHKQLDDRLSLLTGGWRTAGKRHRSLRAALEWSHRSLTPQERSPLRRLSVLPGGFSPESAAAVAADDTIPVAAVPGLLTALEAKSAITSCPGQVGAARFRMLESIRCFVYEQLLAEGEQTQVHGRLADWLAELAAPLQATAVTSAQTLSRLAEEHDNLAYAIEWLTRADDDRQLLLAGALAVAETRQGCRAGTRRPLIRESLRRMLNSTDPRAKYRSLALSGAAMLADQDGEHDEAVRLARLAVDLERGTERHPLIGRLLLLLSAVRESSGDRDAALADLEECLRISRRHDDPLMTAVCLTVLAWHALARDDLDRAGTMMDEALPVLTAEPALSGRPRSAALCVAGALALERGELLEAAAFFRESLVAAADDPDGTAHAMEGLAVAAVRDRRFERGLRLIAAAETFGGATSVSRAWWRDRVGAARAAAVQALPTASVDTCLVVGRKSPRHQAVAYALGEQRDLPARTTADADPLSKREWDVLGYVARGLTNRQIAARMHLSVRTVETHLRGIRTALGLRSRTHIAAWAAQLRPRESAQNFAPKS